MKGRGRKAWLVMRATATGVSVGAALDGFVAGAKVAELHVSVYTYDWNRTKESYGTKAPPAQLLLVFMQTPDPPLVGLQAFTTQHCTSAGSANITVSLPANKEWAIPISDEISDRTIWAIAIGIRYPVAGRRFSTYSRALCRTSVLKSYLDDD